MNKKTLLAIAGIVAVASALLVLLVAAVLASQGTAGQSSASLTGIWEEYGEGYDPSSPGQPHLSSIRSGMLFKGDKMYAFQIGIYDTEQEIIDDEAGLRGYGGASNYATYTISGTQLTLRDKKTGVESTCSISGTDIYCGGTRFVKNN